MPAFCLIGKFLLADYSIDDCFILDGVKVPPSTFINKLVLQNIAKMEQSESLLTNMMLLEKYASGYEQRRFFAYHIQDLSHKFTGHPPLERMLLGTKRSSLQPYGVVIPDYRYIADIA